MRRIEYWAKIQKNSPGNVFFTILSIDNFVGMMIKVTLKSNLINTKKHILLGIVYLPLASISTTKNIFLGEI